MSRPHVLITGASRGLGRAVAERLLRDGAAVTLLARTSDSMSEFRSEGGYGADRCRILPHDLSGPQDFDDLITGVEAGGGPLCGVVHAAGAQLRKPAIAVSEAELLGMLRLHLVVPFLLSTALARAQVDGGRGGSHVFIGSLGSTIAISQAAPYTAAKSGVMGVVRGLAVELAAAGIRVNAVNPGYVETHLTADLLADSQQRARVRGRTPLGRLGTPAEIASVVAFLLSEDSAFVTGEAINADGGWLAA
ncbi:SDR family NAD(P)-dependent oxidoreductase [Leucobacter sp. 7(1)]|uniref:SDR family NAD(P)-dependent oxidoreductase n=1 Tax=Leucobacter sp. 7(1) TaxID=1255613 RepID=UPI000B36363A|nr:SDR family oxidoreductase [Leucobacter sp. 7(1)]